jgi:dephospho-CoA kinase
VTTSAPPPWRVALTGGIASGKSTVSALFAKLGVSLIDADVIAREVQAAGTPVLRQIFERFGAHLRLPDGNLDRPALRSIVFADPALRRELESIVQPAIRLRGEQLATQARGHYVLYVIPLLAETRSQSRFDRILVVDCPEALQLQRLLARDQCDREQASAILAAQASRADRLAIADDIIVNEGDMQALSARVLVLHREYQSLTGPRRTWTPVN